MGHEPGRRARRSGWIAPLLLGAAFLTHTTTAPPVATPPARPPRTDTDTGRVSGVELGGPGGRRVRLPLDEPAVVHVWLQGCADCAPAFEAARALDVGREHLGAPVINVSFGGADPAFAAAYGLDDELVVDDGSQVVRPLGIGTFTTLVLDAHGHVRHVDHPQRAGYLERVQAGLSAARQPLGAPPPPHPAPTPAAPTPSGVAPLQVAGWTLIGLAAAWIALLLPWRRLRREGPLPARELGQEAGIQAGQRCPYCHGSLSEWDWVVRCQGCETAYHDDCAAELARCSSLGCQRRIAAPRAPRATDRIG